MEFDLTFDQIKQQVELPELLTHYGYTLKPGENLAKGKWHVFEGDDTLVVFKGRGNDWMYFNAHDDRDKGTTIDWMKNRVASGRIVGLEQLPDRNVWQSVNDHFRAYLNLPEAERPRLTLPPLEITAPNEKFQNIYIKDCRPLDDTAYLESRGLTKDTLQNPQFAGRILNQNFTVQREGMPPKTYTNTAFPAYNEGRVVGLELKGVGFKGQAPGSEFSRSLWISNPPTGKAPTHLVVSESAIDTLSYAQSHPNEKAIYASTAGILTQNKIYEMKRLMGQEHLTGIKSAFDNDTQGHHFDTRLLAGFAHEQNPMKVIREHPNILTIELTTADVASVQGLTQQLKKFNDQTSQQYYQASGTVPGTAPDPTLRAALISSTRMSPNTYQFHVPMGRETLGAFNQAAVQSLQFEHKIELVKSQGKDWNQDLKQDQMQQVVKRELDEPKKEPLAQSQGPPTQGAATDSQRVVVVEFRESRNEMSQLQALQANLEKAGLTITSSQKLNTDVPRETATAINLSYQADSPKLITISQALDGLASNAKAVVQEPAQDAAERRKQATAAELSQQQKRVSEQQIQPSGSASHDQARHQFIEAAASLAQGMRDNSAGLQAAYLQQISKSLLKQPEIKGIDQENLAKVFAKIDQVPTLKESASANQLRQAVQVLEKPVGQAQVQQQQPERRRGPKLS